MKRYAISVTGKVQGVFFRDTTQRVASRLGLTGFVRNQPDGSVYIEAEGDENSLQQLLTWCQDGPQHAAVENVSHSELRPVGDKSFTIQTGTAT